MIYKKKLISYCKNIHLHYIMIIYIISKFLSMIKKTFY